jgi:hypothetical protein
MKKFVTVLAVVWLSAIVITTSLWRQLHKLRGENAALQAHVTALISRKSVATTRTPQVSAVEAPVTSAAPAPPSALEHAEPRSDDQDFSHTMLRASFPQQYPDLAKELDLTPDELDKLEALVIHQLTSRTFGQSPAEKADMVQFFGEKYPQWQTYQDTLPGRRQVSSLRGELAARGSTLSDEQARPLMAALNAELKRADLNTPIPALPPPTTIQETRDRDLQGMAEVSSRLVKAATPYLNAQQLDSYRLMLNEGMHMRRMTMDAMRETQNQASTRN